MSKTTRDPFAEFFEGAIDASAQQRTTPRVDDAWTEIVAAAESTSPLRVDVGEAIPGGVRATYRGIEGRVQTEMRMPAGEADAWVLKFDRDRNVLELIPWNPCLGPRAQN